MPKLLIGSGVSPAAWKQFTREIRKHASLSTSQWVTCVASGCVYGVFWSVVTGLSGLPMLGFVTYKKRRDKAIENFQVANHSGAIQPCLRRWNAEYFEPKGLHVKVELPGRGMTGDADVSSTKLYRYREKYGEGHEVLEPGTSNAWARDPREKKYRTKEGYYRMKAARKGRIVVFPLEVVPYEGRAARVDEEVGWMGGIEERVAGAE